MTPTSLARRWLWVFHSGLASAAFVTSLHVFLTPFGQLPSARAMLCTMAFVWMMYVLDRLKPQPEDAGAGDESAAGFVKRRRGTFSLLVAALVLVQAACAAAQPRFAVALAASFLASIFYLVPLPWIGKRTKDLPYAKTLHNMLAMVFIPAAVIWADAAVPWSTLVWAAPVPVLLGGINNVLYDLKDIEADRRAGIRTFAVALGPRRLIAGAGAVLAATTTLALLSLPPPLMLVSACLAAFYGAVLWALRARPFDAGFAAAVDAGHAVITFGALVLALGLG